MGLLYLYLKRFYYPLRLKDRNTLQPVPIGVRNIGFGVELRGMSQAALHSASLSTCCKKLNKSCKQLPSTLWGVAVLWNQGTFLTHEY